MVSKKSSSFFDVCVLEDEVIVVAAISFMGWNHNSVQKRTVQHYALHTPKTPKKMYPPPSSEHHTFRCRDALEYPSLTIQELRSVGQSIAHIHDVVMTNSDVLEKALAPFTQNCAYMKMDLERHLERIRSTRPKPRLYLPFAVYIMDRETGQPICINTNTAGGEPVGVKAAVELAREKRYDVEEGPLDAIVKTLSVTARLVHPTEPTVAFYTQHWDALKAMGKCTSADALVHLKECLKSQGINVVYLTALDILERTSIEDNTGDLIFSKQHRISAILPPSMTTGDDLNGHPTGKFVSSEAMLDCSPGSFRAQCEIEWGALDKIEASTAVMAHVWLGGKVRPLWQYLLQDNAKALCSLSNEATKIMAVMPKSYYLSPKISSGEALIAKDKISKGLEELVAINVLRPRLTTTSAGRIAPTILENGSEFLGLSTKETPHLQYYAITRKVPQPCHNVNIQLGQDQTINASCHTELAVYSQYLVDANGDVVIDSSHGLGVRSCPANKHCSEKKDLGYGALGAVCINKKNISYFHYSNSN